MLLPFQGLLGTNLLGRTRVLGLRAPKAVVREWVAEQREGSPSCWGLLAPRSLALQMTTYLRTSSCLTNWPCASTGGCFSSRMFWGTRSAAGLSTGRAAKSPRCAAPPLSMPRRRSRPRSDGVRGLVREGCGGWQDQHPGQRQLLQSGLGSPSVGVRSWSFKLWGISSVTLGKSS